MPISKQFGDESGHVPPHTPSTSPHGRNAAVTFATQASILNSTVLSLSDGPHPPFDSARAHASLNFSSAFVRQASSTAAPLVAAMAWHFSLLLAFFATAFSLEEVQRPAGSAAESGVASNST